MIATEVGVRPRLAGPRARILHVITGMNPGGAEFMLHRLVTRLQFAFDLHVISMIEAGEAAAGLQEAGIPVQTLRLRPGRLNMAAVGELVGAIRRFNPQVVQTWAYHADLVGGIAARYAGVPAIVWNVRNGYLDPSRIRRRTAVVARCCALVSSRVPTKILTCSEAAMKRHIALGYDAGKFQVIPNGFDTERFAPSAAKRDRFRAERGLPDDAILVGLIARADPQKDHETFIDAVTRVAAGDPRVRVILAGQGVDVHNRRLRARIPPSVADRFVMLGHRADVDTVLAALDVAVSSSVSEAFPNAIGEAMACGIPCVATGVGDTPQLVGNTGVLVDPKNVGALADGITSLARSAAMRRDLGARARERILSLFPIDDIAARYADVYYGLIPACAAS